MFLYSLLKSAADAVLKLMSAVIAVAHVLFVSIKSLSVNVMLLEFSFGKLKYDSTYLLVSGFLGSSSVSASRSPLSLAILNFFIYKFSVWVSHTPTHRTKTSIDVPGFYVFHAFTVYILNRDTVISSRSTTSSTIFFRSILSTTKSSP